MVGQHHARRPLRRLRSRWWWAAGGALLVLTAAACFWPEPPRTLAMGLWDIRVELPVPQPAEAVRLLRAAAAGLARRPVELIWAGQRWQLPLDQLGVRLDQGAMVAGGEALLQLDRPPAAPSLAALARVDEEALRLALAPVRAAVEAEPVPAELLVQAGRPVVTPDRPGRRLDLPRLVGDLRDRLSAAPRLPWQPGEPLPAIRIELQTVPVPASPSAPELEALGIRRRLSSLTTQYDAAVPRGENVARAAAALHGVVLRPGELLSYNAAVGPVDADHGWQPANVIVGAQVVEGVGGGVCQTATTLYGAALRAGLEVLERHPHSLPVRYIEPSQDAAVAPGVQDLKLRNTGRTAVLIQARAEAGRVTVEIFGDAPPGLEIQVTSEVLATLAPPTVRRPDAALAPGQTVIEQSGAPGLRSAGYRLYYQDGQLVRQERLSEDTYPSRPQVVRYG